VQEMRAQQQGTFLVSAVIWVHFVCDLLADGLANCAADLNTHGKSLYKKCVSFPLDQPNDLWQILTQCPCRKSTEK
jgi:hypothetical protein